MNGQKLDNNLDNQIIQSHVLWNNGVRNNLPGTLTLKKGTLSFIEKNGKDNVSLPVSDIQNVRLIYPLPRPGAGGMTVIQVIPKNSISEYSFTIMDWLVSKTYGIAKEERADDEFDPKRWLEVFKDSGVNTFNNAATSVIMTAILVLFLLGLILNTVL